MRLNRSYWHDKGSEYTSRWHTYYMKEVSAFLKVFDILPGTIIEYGCYQGKMLDYLIEKYPLHDIVGIDFYNINNHLNIIEMDVKQFRNNYTLSLALNDLVSINVDRDSKVAGRAHALRNLVNGGVYIESSVTPTTNIEGLELIKSSKCISFFVKNT